MADDQCRPVEVDGEIIRVRSGRALTEDERDAFAEIVRAAKRRFEADPVFPQTAPPGHPLYLFSLTRPWRPQDCDCGASTLAMVAHYERCAARR